MENLHYFSLLCFGLSVCANILILGIVAPGLQMINETCEDDLKCKRDMLYDFYRVNKPTILKRSFLLNYYVVNGGLIYYLIAIILSTIILYDSTHSYGKLAIHTVLAFIIYKILMSVIRRLWLLVGRRVGHGILAVTLIVSCLLTVLLMLNLIVVLVY